MKSKITKKEPSIAFENEEALSVEVAAIGFKQKISSVSDLPFVERIVAEVTLEPKKRGGHQGTLKILKTTEGRFMCILMNPDNAGMQAVQCDTQGEVREFFGESEPAKRLYQNAGWKLLN